LTDSRDLRPNLGEMWSIASAVAWRLPGLIRTAFTTASRPQVHRFTPPHYQLHEAVGIIHFMHCFTPTPSSHPLSIWIDPFSHPNRPLLTLTRSHTSLTALLCVVCRWSLCSEVQARGRERSVPVWWPRQGLCTSLRVSSCGQNDSRGHPQPH
jgi:hypothetical protein